MAHTYSDEEKFDILVAAYATTEIQEMETFENRDKNIMERRK